MTSPLSIFLVIPTPMVASHPTPAPSRWKALWHKTWKICLAIALVLLISLGPADSALAARSGGRIGGGSFRAPSRTLTQPRTYRAPSGGGYGGGYYPGGGGFGFPFLLPFFGFGGGFGGLFGLFLIMGVANFLVQTLRNRSEDKAEAEVLNPTVTVAQVQVGLLAAARPLQADLNRMALEANTQSATGLAQVLQEATLALLRHPEYWHYAATSHQAIPLSQAEDRFNQLVLGERSKFSSETLVNVNSQVQQRSPVPSTDTDGKPGEYIVVTLVVAAQGQWTLPKVTSGESLRQALAQVGAIGGDRLMAVEILWTPQATGESLTAEEVIAAYPNLGLV